MEWDEACALWRRLHEASADDPQLGQLEADLVRRAVRYARLRVDWLLADPEHRGDMSEERTRTHNALIDACNILSRQLHQRGRDTTWRAQLGDDRVRIGDYACYIHAMLGLRAG